MALFSQKKSRSSRTTTLSTSASWVRRWSELLNDRSALARIGISLIAVIAMLIAVEGWKAPFRFRLDMRPVHGIAAKVAFQRVNRTETEKARSRRESQVPYVFKQNPKPLEDLPTVLRDHLYALAAAESLVDVRPELRTVFGLTSPDLPGQPASGDTEQLFALLKSAVTSPDGSSEQRINRIVTDFAQFIAPLRSTGIIDLDEVTQLGIRPGETIAIVNPQVPREHETVTLRNVQLSEILKEGGSLGRSWSAFPSLVMIQPMLENWILSLAPTTLKYDASDTQRLRREAREQVAAIYDDYDVGELLVAPGSRIDDAKLALLRAEYDAAEQHVPRLQRVARIVTVLILLIVLGFLNAHYLVYNEPHLIRSVSRLGVYLAVLVLAVGIGRQLSFDPWRAEIIPLLTASMMFAIGYNQVLAALTAFTLALLMTISTVGNLGQFVILMSVSATAVIPLSQVASRSALVKVGFWTAIVYFAISWGVGIIEAQNVQEIGSDQTLLWSSLRGAGWCLVAGYLVAGSLPFVESMFGMVTDISLLEMSDVSHPLLQQLIQRAPGTYNHSVSVATVGEAAADAIGANGLLVRVGAYFHDIGKMLKPQYFVENMSADSKSLHDQLVPAMSTLIIIGHVKDGADLAHQANLPQQLIDFIEQHHGTTLVGYFYHRATQHADQAPGKKSTVEESSFRYPGPKPQTREAGVLMLADAVESASRTLSEPTPKRLETLVHEIAMARLLDGQFDECSLTLREIRIIQDSLTKSLIAIHHGRIKYPEQRTA